MRYYCKHKTKEDTIIARNVPPLLLYTNYKEKQKEANTLTAKPTKKHKYTNTQLHLLVYSYYYKLKEKKIIKIILSGKSNQLRWQKDHYAAA